MIEAVPVGTAPVARLLHSAIHYREYRVLWLGSVAGFFAFNMQTVAMSYVGYQLTGSAAALGLIWLAWGGSQMVLSLFGGALADRLPKRTTIRLTQGLLMVSALAIGVVIALGIVELWMLIVAGVFQGVAFAFNAPARQAFVPLVVPRERLTNALALQNMANNVANAAGPAIAGAIIAITLSPASVYFTMVGLYLVVQFSLFFLRTKGDPLPSDGPRRSVISDIKEGLGVVARAPLLRTLVLLTLVPILVGSSPTILLPAYVAQQLGGSQFLLGVPLDDAAMLGLLSAAVGLGAFIGSLAIAYFAQMERRGLLQICLGFGIASGMIVVGVTSWFPVAFVGFLIAGLCMNAFMTSNQALVMLAAPPHVYGRVFSLNMLMFSLTGFTAVPFGFMADNLGPGNTYLIFAAVMASVMVGVMLFLPRIRNLRTSSVVPDPVP